MNFRADADRTLQPRTEEAVLEVSGTRCSCLTSLVASTPPPLKNEFIPLGGERAGTVGEATSGVWRTGQVEPAFWVGQRVRVSECRNYRKPASVSFTQSGLAGVGAHSVT